MMLAFLWPSGYSTSTSNHLSVIVVGSNCDRDFGFFKTWASYPASLRNVDVSTVSSASVAELLKMLTSEHLPLDAVGFESRDGL